MQKGLFVVLLVLLSGAVNSQTEDLEWTNIRITPYFDYLLNTSQSTYTSYVLQHQISSAIRFYEKMIKIPIIGNSLTKPLRLKKDCSGPNNNECTTFCGATKFEIPSEHLDAEWITNEDDCEVIDVSPPGLGVIDTDLLVYAMNEDYLCSGKSWQTVCERNEFGRPIAILLNFCNVQFTQNALVVDFEEQLDIIMHELTHGMVLGNDTFTYWYPQRPIDEIIHYDDENRPWLITDVIRETAQTHFHCTDIPGVMMDSQLYHFHSRMLNMELMSDVADQYLYLTQFTLALMIDSGWYHIDYDDFISYGAPYYFGLHQGCAFVYEDCINHIGISNFRDFWCDSQDDVGCFFDYTRTSEHCQLRTDLFNEESIPGEYQYYGFSSIGGPPATDYCPYMSVSKEVSTICVNNETDNNVYDSRCIEAWNGQTIPHCYNIECDDYNSNNQEYNKVIIYVNDDDGNDQKDNQSTIVCTKNDEGGQVNVRWLSDTNGYFSIRCPIISRICGTSSRPFECNHGHYSDVLSECICNPGFKGPACNQHDLGIENLQLYNSDDFHDTTNEQDTILITYYKVFCIHGLQWGVYQDTDQMNGFWEIRTNLTNHSSAYNPTYVNKADPKYQIKYRYCDNEWYLIEEQLHDDFKVIAKCVVDSAQWSDYGSIENCNSNWLIDHEYRDYFMRDVNVEMSVGVERDMCVNELNSKSDQAPIASYPYLCVSIMHDFDDLDGTYVLGNITFNGYAYWYNFDSEHDETTYLYYDNGQWIFNDKLLYNHGRDQWFYICGSYSDDVFANCTGTNKFVPHSGLNQGPYITINISANICKDDTKYTNAPTSPTSTPTKYPSTSPTVTVKHDDSVCLQGAGATFDGYYKWNGTLNGHPFYIKPYLPQLQRPFVYIFNNGNEWIVYRDVNSEKYWFLKCDEYSDWDVSNCSSHWRTSWNGHNPSITLTADICLTTPPYTTGQTVFDNTPSDDSDDEHYFYPFVCLSGAEYSNLDGSYEIAEEEFNNRPVYRKEFYPDFGKPWVYIKFEEGDWNSWIVYYELATSNYYIYCNSECSRHFNGTDPSRCDGCWVASWINSNGDEYHYYDNQEVDVVVNNIDIAPNQCNEDNNDGHTTTTGAPQLSSTTISSGNAICVPQSTDEIVTDNENDKYPIAICLNGIDDLALQGVYKINGSYNNYPLYVKDYLPEQGKPVVYIKYESFTISNEVRYQWIIYRSLCSSSYYLYCDHAVDSQNVELCSVKWHTSWSGIQTSINMTSNLTECDVTAGTGGLEMVPGVEFPMVVCLNHTVANNTLLDGKYQYAGILNKYPYYSQTVVVEGTNMDLYLKFQSKWLLYNVLDNNDFKYFLECDSDVQSLDVSKCNHKWKGDSKTPDNVGSVRCDADNNVGNYSTSEETIEEVVHKAIDQLSEQQKDLIISLTVIISALLLCIVIAVICYKKRNSKKHKFKQIANQTDIDDDGYGDTVDGDQDVDVDYTKRDVSGDLVGGSTGIHVISNDQISSDSEDEEILGNGSQVYHISPHSIIDDGLDASS